MIDTNTFIIKLGSIPKSTYILLLIVNELDNTKTSIINNVLLDFGHCSSFMQFFETSDSQKYLLERRQ